MTYEKEIEQMREICKNYSGDNEVIHSKLDDFVIEFLPKEIKDEYNRIRDDVGFWYA